MTLQRHRPRCRPRAGVGVPRPPGRSTTPTTPEPPRPNQKEPHSGSRSGPRPALTAAPSRSALPDIMLEAEAAGVLSNLRIIGHLGQHAVEQIERWNVLTEHHHQAVTCALDL